MSFLNAFRKVIRHADLLEGMIARVDVREAMSEVPHAAEVKRRALARCMTCEEPDACEIWLNEHVSADETPHFCRNHNLMARLKQMTEAPSPSA
ncbi:MAG: DUF6455 family protein [Notoacmeibacter sp.]|nr:DUF6455 family protein [Notoacmeibacter sp.]